MIEEKDLQTISCRKQDTWIKGCPMQVTEVKLCYNENSSDKYIIVASKKCTDRKVAYYIADVDYYNDRREKINESQGLRFQPIKDCLNVEFTDAAYAEVIIKEVLFEEGAAWHNQEGARGDVLPDPNIIWQTDPLYKVIKAVTQGQVDSKYYPQDIDGGWRCACGSVNTEDSLVCGHCKCSKAWLDVVFDRDYLENQKTAVESGKKPESVKKIKKKEAEKTVSDKTKMILIFSAIFTALVLTVLSVVYFIPQKKYNDAHKYASMGMYDKAIKAFEDLGNFKNSRELVHTFTYEKFVNLTGVADLYITDSASEPWFKVSETGVLEFVDTKYEGGWEHVDIPHVVDGVVVTELAKNFFVNCDELVSITLPDTLLVIGEQAFMNCSSLEQILFGSRITEIQPRTFINCSSLTEITIPDSVSMLGQRAFNNCSQLSSVTVGEGIRAIGAYTFSNCTSLETVAFRSPITEIGEYAFDSCETLSMVVCYFDKKAWAEPEIEAGNESFQLADIIFN